ncbi:MAG: hypothetical protein KJ824_11470 [Alphaproteobacteria bacterium]|nr:hypothetical protein [Alphaproteobacteria bacterium]
MADGALNLTFDDYISTKIVEKAKALGVSPEEFATTLLDQQLFDHDDFIWINGDPRTERLSPADFEGARDWDEVRPEFLALIEKTFGPE